MLLLAIDRVMLSQSRRGQHQQNRCIRVVGSNSASKGTTRGFGD